MDDYMNDDDIPFDVRNGVDYPLIDHPDKGQVLTTALAAVLHTAAAQLCNVTRCGNVTDLSSLDPDFSGDDPDLDPYSGNRTVEEVLAVVVPILFGTIAIVGFFGNALVVMVVLCNPQMRSTTNLLIINLAMADLLFIVFCVPFTGWDYTLSYWPFGDVWCRIVQYLVIVCAYASIYTLVLMSLDRFLAVVHPITSMSIRTERNAYIAICLTWIVILLACVPALFAHGMMTHGRDSGCTFRSDLGYNWAAFQICFFLSSYVVPLSLTFVLYVLMLKRLWFGVAPGGRVSADSVRSKKRVTRLVVVVVVVFAVCWCPVQVVLVLKSVNAYGKMNPPRIVIQIASQILAYTNSCVNPFLYAFLSENFRKSFRKIILCNSRVLGSGPARTRDDFERTERETMAGNCSAGKSTKISNDIL
ncbi:allatostatin-A receptor-like [Ornithodoros turicata]|uniref:allatostatin-A receptor-like n=1 Tax=Ornithodoros turicata TaxID=34597 RepID=UPI003139BEBC